MYIKINIIHFRMDKKNQFSIDRFIDHIIDLENLYIKCTQITLYI